MKMQSQRAQAINAYLAAHTSAEIGKWPIEIAGTKQVLPYYRLPTELLRYNVNNGRLVMERRHWEKEHEHELDPESPNGAAIIRSMLISTDSSSELLKSDIRQKGQMEPGVITHDGIVINANRRMAVLELLHEEEPTGKWQTIEVVRLPSDTSEADLWKIEAGLQLSKDKVLDYHPVNELLKIKEGIDRGLSPSEVAAALYGRDEDEIKGALERLELIDNFLLFMKQPNAYGTIKTFGLHEYFIDIQKRVIAPAIRDGIDRAERTNRIRYAFALIRANIEGKSSNKGRKQRPITHWDIRRLNDVFSDPHAYDQFVSEMQQAKDLRSVPHERVIEGFRDSLDVLHMREERNQPVKLIEKAIQALESINRDNEHFKHPRVRSELTRLKELIQGIESELDQQ